MIFLLAQKDKKIKTIDPDARSCFLCVSSGHGLTRRFVQTADGK